MSDTVGKVRRPGAELAARPRHLVWILDCSAALALGGDIQTLNFLVRSAIRPIREAADENPNQAVLIRALAFSSGAQWLVPDPVEAHSFTWSDVGTGGHARDLGLALRLVADQLMCPPMTERAHPPILILLSGGAPTDDFDAGLAMLRAAPFGRRAERIAVKIGRHADDECLRRFIGNAETRPLHQEEVDALSRYIVRAVGRCEDEIILSDRAGETATSVPRLPPPDFYPDGDDTW